MYAARGHCHGGAGERAAGAQVGAGIDSCKALIVHLVLRGDRDRLPGIRPPCSRKRGQGGGGAALAHRDKHVNKGLSLDHRDPARRGGDAKKPELPRANRVLEGLGAWFGDAGKRMRPREVTRPPRQWLGVSS
jgi:hypothetical protein